MRDFCLRCRRAARTCYCDRIRPFETEAAFVILIHPRETRKRIGTGRLASLFLPSSELIDGVAFDADPRVERWLKDPACHCVVLFPGPGALNLSQASRAEVRGLTPRGKRLVVFVIDGTWSHAKTMLRASPRIQALPQIAFDPSVPSNYRIREQPGPRCLSTLEAIHTLLEFLEPQDRKTDRDRMLNVFAWMVDQQIAFESAR